MARRNKIRSDGCDYESSGGFDPSPIVLYLLMVADVVISVMGACPAMAGNGKNTTH